MTIGAGFSRVGLDPAGFGAPEAAPELRETYAAVSRRLDPTTGDYSRGFYDPDAPGYEAMPIALAKVLVALGNTRGSFAFDTTLGDPSLTLRKDDGRVVERVTAYTRAQLEPMVTAKEIEIVSIEVTVVQGAYGRVVLFRDLSTGQELRATS